MDINGTIIAVLPAQSGVSQRTGNNWMSQEYVIEVPAQYPKKCCFKIFGEDRIKQFNIQPGEQNVTVQFDIDAHEFNGRWFNEIRAYNVIRGQQTATSSPATAQAPAATSQPAQTQDMFGGQQAQNPFPPEQPQEGADDLPF